MSATTQAAVSHLAAQAEAARLAREQEKAAREKHAITPDALADVLVFQAAEMLADWTKAARAVHHHGTPDHAYRAIAQAVEDDLRAEMTRHPWALGLTREPRAAWCARNGYAYIYIEGGAA